MIDVINTINPFLVSGILILTFGGEILGIIALATWILSQYDFQHKVKQAVTTESDIVESFTKGSLKPVAADVETAKKVKPKAAKPKVKGMDD